MSEAFTQEQIAKYKEAFSLFDRNGDGNLSTKDLGTVMRSLGMAPTESELAEMINEVDTNKKGSIDFNEFLNLISEHPEQKNAEEEIREAFREFDRENTGQTTSAELRQVLTTIGDKLTNEEVDDLLREAGVGNDDKINIEDFVKLLSSC